MDEQQFFIADMWRRMEQHPGLQQQHPALLQQRPAAPSAAAPVAAAASGAAAPAQTQINHIYFTEVRVSLSAGQQVRGKFTSIRDMTNFKIQLESCSDVNFLCSYDDAKFFESNKDLPKPFKEHYEGKLYALDI
ncbi:hypothetical protein ACLKA7_005087 [Drosophila subpalustris]